MIVADCQCVFGILVPQHMAVWQASYVVRDVHLQIENFVRDTVYVRDPLRGDPLRG
ncbi:MAG: hypothetical protein ACI9HK_004852 [Pirellulaceae bacterium]|jgi:hypothetical protein